MQVGLADGGAARLAGPQAHHRLDPGGLGHPLRPALFPGEAEARQLAAARAAGRAFGRGYERLGVAWRCCQHVRLPFSRRTQPVLKAILT